MVVVKYQVTLGGRWVFLFCRMHKILCNSRRFARAALHNTATARGGSQCMPTLHQLAAQDSLRRLPEIVRHYTTLPATVRSRWLAMFADATQNSLRRQPGMVRACPWYTRLSNRQPERTYACRRYTRLSGRFANTTQDSLLADATVC